MQGVSGNHGKTDNYYRIFDIPKGVMVEIYCTYSKGRRGIDLDEEKEGGIYGKSISSLQIKSQAEICEL